VFERDALPRPDRDDHYRLRFDVDREIAQHLLTVEPFVKVAKEIIGRAVSWKRNQ